MVVVERESFQPLGEQSRRQMIHEGISALPPLEPGAIITHDMVAAWIGEPFPIPRPVRGGDFLVPDYGPMDAVKTDLLLGLGVLLLTEANVGWRVATDAEMVSEAEASWRKASEWLGRASLVARKVDPTKVSVADGERARAIQVDVQAEQRVLTAKARERARQASKWG